MVTYISTRGGGADSQPKSFEDVLLAGLAGDGGLYVPESWPQFSHDDLIAMRDMPYVDVAYQVMKPFVGDALSDEEFRSILAETYDSDVFVHKAVTPLSQISEKIWIMEHFHGPTLAFKDVALQLLGRLFDHVLEKRGERITIVGATSGDTGSAAIEACRHCKNVDIFILHPQGRVSEVQRRQMSTVLADNVFNIALEGTFDDCQNMVKVMFGDETFRNEVRLSAINSINWARIMAQIVYYVTTSLALGGPERRISYSVPTGNFGNIFAAYAAKQMGVPLGDMIISTNRNDILTRFFETGAMTMEGVEPSLSPSMDIQISSNFERFLFDVTGRDAGRVQALMNEFKDQGRFGLDDGGMEKARAQFHAHRCSDDDTLGMIRKMYDKVGFVVDPHTAVALSGAYAYAREIDGPIVALACAHAAKFPDAVEKAVGIRPPLPMRMSDLFDREERLTPMPDDFEKVTEFVKSHSRVTSKQAA